MIKPCIFSFLFLGVFPFGLSFARSEAQKGSEKEEQKKVFSLDNRWASPPLQSDEQIENFIQNMSDEQKIAQLMLIGVQTRSQYAKIFEVFFPGGFIDYRNFVSKNDFGATWFKGVEFLQENSLKKTSLLSFYMVNQEGGEISRFKRKLLKQKSLESLGAESSYWDMPGPLKLARAENLKAVEELAKETGKLLLTLGINMNLAPVVDVFNPKIDGYIRGRSFSSDPYEVQENSRAFTAGLQKVGVIATFKHFPGYTDSLLDSHKKLVTIPLNKKQFIEKHWIPYQFKEGYSYPKAIMTNIAFYPQLDSQRTAPLSKKIVTGFLKQELAYRGLIMTDDIGMDGFKEPDLSKRAIQALLAGQDMILLSVVKADNIILIYKALLQAFKQGLIPKKQVHESLKKVLQLKAGLSYKPLAFEKKVQLIEQSKEKLYLINKQLTQSMVDSFFKQNPYLKASLSKDVTVISFSKASYQVLESLKYFSKHKKNFSYIQAHSSNKKSQKKPLNLSDQQIAFCYGKVAKSCHQYFSKAQKKYVIMIDTRNKPLPLFLWKDYKIYIPTYGMFPGVGEMFLKPMISK